MAAPIWAFVAGQKSVAVRHGTLRCLVRAAALQRAARPAARVQQLGALARVGSARRAPKRQDAGRPLPGRACLVAHCHP